ncbi:MAG: hypothetical protein A3C79_01060 [Candidatus Taylorbacteria bacterium RIFCSPHIGHO2_02_FULL_45_28]|uniref:Uncharacterized protein n=1 Tax=Candidatus Taylorbacteria bacterium RIFCSPHIGHO2_12_FULL_45_16 TaxID=1802315 RepID=A0A1G2MZ96_9BACT|nr:MAG: hypothetical protein A2830_02310 [Candidatus Taylorbacteria bacterium RIFCSPHIGHO2_01_FULL_44_110]OHA25609.1 MAG: hypothetical protein A3C79_01060 [Candidatus Taylorbacteria bacterium RIFCSPHIGHO2_02_FULL_45_28]OHA29275.1 MAG: hypothetical protein A3F51_01525 [Candidatus Taylorbacteria bacterium RIFCSPHIGHO2_12_FULL_45_16]OHA33497.1 MAG: hypothetical protein A3A23_02405 [Candidatus Taylorbacteria bacterium RIFCSPLOWO2_01_FULL_45_59]OHA38366.1 MAG: hypothetical protein A3I98_03290 [Candi
MKTRYIFLVAIIAIFVWVSNTYALLSVSPAATNVSPQEVITTATDPLILAKISANRESARIARMNMQSSEEQWFFLKWEVRDILSGLPYVIQEPVVIACFLTVCAILGWLLHELFGRLVRS